MAGNVGLWTNQKLLRSQVLSGVVGRLGGGGGGVENMDILLISVGHSYLGFVRTGVKQYSSISLSFVVRP